MAISFGLKSPMDYSVFSGSGASVLLALDAFRRKKSQVFSVPTVYAIDCVPPFDPGFLFPNPSRYRSLNSYDRACLRS